MSNAPSPLLVPTLQRPDWRGRELAVHQPLLGTSDARWMPVLTFADDGVATRTLRTEGDPEALRTEASANLVQLPYRMHVLGEADTGMPHEIVILEGHEYTAEQVLCAETMRRVATRLGAGQLLVGVPRRGVLQAIDAAAPERALGVFLKMVSTQYFRAEQEGISPLGFLVVDGVVCGSADGLAESGRLEEAESIAPPEIQISRVADVVHVRTGGSFDAGFDPVLRQTLRHFVALGAAGQTEPLSVELRFTDVALKDAEADGLAGYLRRMIDEVGAQGPMPTVLDVRVRSQAGLHEPLAQRLSDEVRRDVGLAPYAALGLVVSVSGELTTAHMEAFSEAFLRSPPLLHAALAYNQLSPEEGLALLLNDGDRLVSTLDKAARGLRDALGDEANETITALFDIGVHVATAGSTDGSLPEPGRLALGLLGDTLGVVSR